MGIDVQLYAQGAVTDEELARANEFCRVRGVRGWEDEDPPLTRNEYVSGRVEWDAGIRYYGPGYERGYWPAIHNAIVCLRAALPNCTVHYGGDIHDDVPEVTDEMLAEIWAHWLSPEGDAYHERSRVFNAMRAAGHEKGTQ